MSGNDLDVCSDAVKIASKSTELLKDGGALKEIVFGKLLDYLLYKAQIKEATPKAGGMPAWGAESK